MGATDFSEYRTGTNAQVLFDQAREEARYDAEREGMEQFESGSIWGKDSFELRKTQPMTMAEAEQFIEGNDENEIERDIENNRTWGPAFAVPIRADDGTEIIGFWFYGFAPE